MTNPYTAPVPPTPRPPDSRPLHRRVLIWAGGAAVFVTGALIGSAGDDGQQSAVTGAAPATTVTAAPDPGPTVTETVTETVEAEAEPGPTVTVTETATVRAAEGGGTSTSTSTSNSNSNSNSNSQDSTGTCSIVSNAGNCYAAGQFCRNSDHGAVTTTAGGDRIRCAYSANAWRWIRG